MQAISGFAICAQVEVEAVCAPPAYSTDRLRVTAVAGDTAMDVSISSRLVFGNVEQ